MTDREKVKHILHSMDVCSAGFVCNECPLQKKCAERKDLSVAELAHEYLEDVDEVLDKLEEIDGGGNPK